MNRLGAQTSPYLLQHKDNPVHWHAWGEEALGEAKRHDKPILLSVGYAACHWCHVMAHESFEDARTAELMNDTFVNIKVDREERPDIDAVYQRALMLMGHRGGWPLTMFLMPSGEPFYGGTYFPPAPRYGMPSFTQILTGIAKAYRDDRDAVRADGGRVAAALARMSAISERPAAGPWSPRLSIEAAMVLNAHLDRVDGGFGGAPKFPQPPLLELLLHGGRRNGDPALIEGVRFTLERIARGGIHDHLGGGFARYSVDEQWLVPHFEKMLYDNAQLLSLFARVGALCDDPLLVRAAEGIVAWLDREMITADGAFAASQDADSEGEEGRYFVWKEAEIDAVLGPLSPRFKKAYGVSRFGNWEGKTVLNRLDDPEPRDDGQGLAEARATLFGERSRRVPPGRDDKVLADWNGLMVAALARAGATLDRPDWLALAERGFAAARAVLSGGDPASLAHAFCAGRRTSARILDDYAAMAMAALTLFQVTGDPSYLKAAEAWMDVVETDFRDETGGGYFMTPRDGDGLIVRPKTGEDGVIPSGNGLAAEALATLHHLTGEARWAEAARSVLDAFAPLDAEAALTHPTLLRAGDLVDDPILVVLVATAQERPPFVAAFAAAAGSDALLLPVAPDFIAPPGHPAHSKTRVDGMATAYLCRNQTCEAPITDPRRLKDSLLGR